MTAVFSADTRGHQLSERASGSLTRHFAQVMSLPANGSVWSWRFAVWERELEGEGSEGMWLEMYEEKRAEEKREWDGDAEEMNDEKANICEL